MISPTTIFTTLISLYDHVTPPHRQLLGVPGTEWPLLHELFYNQAPKLEQLQTAINALEDCALEAQSNTMDAATKAMPSIAQAIFVKV